MTAEVNRGCLVRSGRSGPGLKTDGSDGDLYESKGLSRSDQLAYFFHHGADATNKNAETKGLVLGNPVAKQLSHATSA